MAHRPHPPLRDILRAELDRQGLTIAELSRRIAAARNPPAEPRTLSVSLSRALGAQDRTIAEGLFLEALEALGVEIVLAPRRAK